MIENIKALTNAQYEQCRNKALQLTQKRLGDKPTRDNYKREYGALLNVLDYIAFVVFIAAFLVSSVHILKYAGSESYTSYQQAIGAILGLTVPDQVYGLVHQFGLIALAEASMLLFFVLFRIRQGFEKWVSFGLAFLAMVFIVIANLSSGLTPFLSLIVPAFTVGIGFRLEAIIVESLKRKEAIDSKYQQAISEYEKVSHEPEDSKLFKQIFANEIWQKLVSLKANQQFIDADVKTKELAVLREMERDKVFENLDTKVSKGGSYTDDFLKIVSPNGHKVTTINNEE